MVDFGRSLRRLRVFPLIASTLLLVGCPLLSDYPLSDPKAAEIDAELIGSWQSMDADSGKVTRLRFIPFDEHELIGLAIGDDRDESSALRVFTTEIEGTRFINVKELGKDSGTWSILRYGIEEGKLRLTSVDDGLFRGRVLSGSAELYEAIRRNLDDPRLYSPAAGEAPDDMVWERVPEAPAKNG
jgi:hypothetical protein